MSHERRADEADADAPEELRCVDAGKLLVVDGELRQRRASTPVLDRPVDTDPAAVVQRPVPRPQDLRVRGRGSTVDYGRWMLFEPPPELAPERADLDALG